MKEKFDALVEHLLDTNIFLVQAIEILEKSMIRASLERAQGNQCAVAKELGIHRNTLLAKIRKYGVENGRRPRRKTAARAVPARKRKTSAA